MGTITDREREYTTEMLWHELGQQYQAGMAQRSKIGPGATVPFGYVQQHARALFVAAINRMAPHVVRDLLRVENFDLLEDGMTASVRGTSDQRGQLESEAAAQFREHRAYIERWQEKHHLTGDWLRLAAAETTVSAYAAGYTTVIKPEFLAQFPDGMPLLLSESAPSTSLHDGKEHGQPKWRFPRSISRRDVFRENPEYKLVKTPVYLDNLKYSPDETDDWLPGDDGMFGTFDPRTETAEDATTRLLPELKGRLRAALQSIADEDRLLNRALRPVEFRKATRFERLVRYQVLGDSIAKIAREDDVDRKGIRDDLEATAELIGLTLRPRDRGGRPRKYNAA